MLKGGLTLTPVLENIFHPSIFRPDSPWGGIKQLFGQMGKKTAPDPSKFYLTVESCTFLWFYFPNFPGFFPSFALMLPNFSHFITFGKVKTKNFGVSRRFGSKLIWILPRPHPRAWKIGEENRCPRPWRWGKICGQNIDQWYFHIRMTSS